MLPLLARASVYDYLVVVHMDPTFQKPVTGRVMSKLGIWGLR